MMRQFRSSLLLLVALWLPVQAAYAVAMPFCRHAAEQAAQTAASQAAAHCHEHDAVVADAADNSSDCDDCAVCHLATAGYLPATMTHLAPDAPRILVTLPVLALPSHIGDPPQQPPRRKD